MTPDVLHSLEKPDLFEKFKHQMHRDFELSGLSEYSPNISSNHLNLVYDQLLNSVLQIERNSSNGLTTLLYRIDINEHQINTAAHQYPAMPLHHIIVELIIKRELQKVVLKEQYSK
jgi:hypothetical protein